MGLFLENGVLTVNISNETMEDFRGRIQLSLRKNDLTVLDALEAPVAVKKLKSRDVYEYELPQADPYSSFIAVDLFDGEGKLIMRQQEMLVPCKHFQWQKPNFQTVCQDVEGGVAIDISADTFARGVCLDFRDFDCVLSDNFFALTDGKPYRVVARTEHRAAELAEQLTIRSVYDIR